jgi:phage-related tail fiber protein
MAARSYIRKVGTGSIYNESDEFMAGQSAWFDGPVDKIPAGWLIKNGAAISRTTYATLFAVIGTMHGAGDGATTFNLPDDRGEFQRGLDLGRGVDPGRVQGSTQGAAIGDHDHEIPIRNGQSGNNYGLYNVGPGGASSGPSTATRTDRVGSGITAGETRPRNRASIPIIKYS